MSSANEQTAFPETTRAKCRFPWVSKSQQCQGVSVLFRACSFRFVQVHGAVTV